MLFSPFLLVPRRKSFFNNWRSRKKQFDINEYKISIKSIGVRENVFDFSYDELKDCLINKEYFYLSELEKKERIKNIIKENNYFYLNLVSTYNEIEIGSIKIIEKIKDDYITNLANIDQDEELQLIKTFSSKKYSLIINSLNQNLTSCNSILSFAEKLNRISNYNYPITKLIIDYDKIYELESTLEKYVLRISVLNTEKSKLIFLKKEASILKSVVVFSFIIFVLGIIYPLSFVKYTNESLDFSIHNNFFSELFSLSGLFLLGIFLFFLIICFLLWNNLDSCTKIEKEYLDKINKTFELGDDDWIIKNYLEFKKF